MENLAKYFKLLIGLSLFVFLFAITSSFVTSSLAVGGDNLTLAKSGSGRGSDGGDAAGNAGGNDDAGGSGLGTTPINQERSQTQEHLMIQTKTKAKAKAKAKTQDRDQD